MAHVPSASRTRSTHRVNRRATHISDAFEPALVGHEAAQKQEAQVDQLMSTQNLMEGAVTMSKLNLHDEFGSTVLDATGFKGSWEDTIQTGIYNGAFNDNESSGADLLIAGRTKFVPYWTVDISGGATATSSVGGVSMKIYGAAHTVTLTSDKIKLRQNMRYRVLVADKFGTSNDITRTVSVLRYARGAFVDTVGLDAETVTTTLDAGIRDCGTFLSSDAIDPVVAETTQVEIQISYEWAGLGTNSSLNAVNLYEVMLVAEPFERATRFPTDPRVGARQWRDDLKLEFFFDGTRWLSVQLFRLQMGFYTAANPPVISANTVAYHRDSAPSLVGGSDIWLEDYIVSFYVSGGGTALGASHNWVAQLKGLRDATNATETNYGAGPSINSGASQNVRRLTVALDTLMNNGTVHDILQSNWTKTGTPGDLQTFEEVTYRVVAV